MNASDLRKLSAADLTDKRGELSKELFNMKFQLNTGRLENTGKLKLLRRDIARINTIINENRG